MELRPRQVQDVEQLEAVASAVRALDHGYPPRLPDLFTSPAALTAWVAIDASAIVGHVELQPAAAEPVMTLAADKTGWASERLAAVARLFVAPGIRRRGVGRMLLDRSVEEAHEIGRWPVLDVGKELRGAVALYEACGWTRIGTVTFPFRDGPATREADSYVYLGPPPPST